MATASNLPITHSYKYYSFFCARTLTPTTIGLEVGRRRRSDKKVSHQTRQSLLCTQNALMGREGRERDHRADLVGWIFTVQRSRVNAIQYSNPYRNLV